MKWHRVGLSVALLGGSIWCLGRVQQVHSEGKAAPGFREPPYKVLRPLNAVSEGGDLSLERGGNRDRPLESTGRRG